MGVTRGVSNGNERGSAEDRRRRKEWLLETYRADIDLVVSEGGECLMVVPLGKGLKACRCYRCGKPLWFGTLTTDRIVPGCKGGTYRRTNIRPACSGCNSETGGPLAKAKIKKVTGRRGHHS